MPDDNKDMRPENADRRVFMQMAAGVVAGAGNRVNEPAHGCRQEGKGSTRSTIEGDGGPRRESNSASRAAHFCFLRVLDVLRASSVLKGLLSISRHPRDHGGIGLPPHQRHCHQMR